MDHQLSGQPACAPSCSAARRIIRQLLLVAAVMAVAPGHAQQQQQPVLGTWSHVGMLPGYTEMFVADIDNAGRIVGGVWGPGGASTSVLYSNGRLSEIANLGLPGGSAADISNTGYIVGGALDRGDPPRTIAYIHHPDGARYTQPGPPNAAWSRASHVNDVGEAVGTASLQYPGSLDAVQSAFLYDRNGQRHTLGWGAYTVATGLNNAGQVVGQGHRPGSDTVRAFTWRNGTTIDLGTLGGAIATTAGINEAGQIAGTSTLAGPLSEAPRHAYLWDNGVMTDLGTLGGRDSNAWDLNNAGDVVGSSAVDGSGLFHRAFLWRDGTMRDLGTFGGLGSVALQVNERGDVVGVAELDELDYKGNPVQHAFLWRDGRLIDLSASLAASFNDISQIDPYSVHMNDVGHITLYGITAGGLRGIFLLTQVPEPATWAMLLAGALTLWVRLRRRVGSASARLATSTGTVRHGPREVAA
ncbi:PEP-CTERM sorting domain-containing protein [Methylibium rhizosphaerae]|uniref:PEP-CTERM sorting domain-containing protein n=1 Tax=Methylibium rhizosphaerae TaxID=2570323 RepID=UPI0015E382E9|nr:PEP-CTERM sorting domain-containing protein [Methylibium rhizosphaerae]